jgi:hypothetical protein
MMILRRMDMAIQDFIDSTGKMPGHPFHFPSAGFSWNEPISASANQSKDRWGGGIWNTANGGLKWSAYRLHVQDPLLFDVGMKLTWRNGDI